MDGGRIFDLQIWYPFFFTDGHLSHAAEWTGYSGSSTGSYSYPTAGYPGYDTPLMDHSNYLPAGKHNF